MNSDPRQDLIHAATQFYQLGWMVGTAGNLSAKLPDGSFWITASGKSKGQLTENDFVRVSPDGEVLESPHPQNRPSAETSIHQTLYSLFPDANACYHVHSIEANLVSRFTEKDNLPLPPLEMLKGLGVWTENPEVVMPVFKNYLEVPRIAAEIGDRFKLSPPDVPALLIVYHGVTVWADSPEKAKNYLEIAEYIFRYIVASHQLSL
ncbi:methylthioribulose-1-phosphate dehydratase [Gloeothece citriformis PCC 7424]|uniref:Methylthioribulose-1-phosphate dehydratase n=1 Tax=Gloeothece citriformis (strain PCC 7424) TaxID=65393 RepID=B7KAV3_GLOC7|nr:methylthioribulose 1-phosphate dehydratase [Gloeothece citriformis]ACK68775.1 methylthioribulose-1-phosphate dehydratase [Gloeothece citriformis PCC 7424]